MKTKKKILILFKSPWDWNKFIIHKLSKFYNVEHLYINGIQNKNFSEILSEINKKIEEDKIEIVFFEADYYKFVNLYFISKIKNVNIDREPRGWEKASDHTPVIIELEN